jgi:hypothetical protein
MMMWGSFASSLQPHVLWSRNDNSIWWTCHDWFAQ